ncbi:voltage-dependent calcium channel type A subunit alpha-1 isoform X1 [Hydra vulgaris]|uniref:voltage-dependent calcium channel type A subunit alpha-1 isoform X1 n=1 Tax=Hydra vulgaris TaxID=6087 RepID=UPI001F5F7392|nr:voltage-dependent calcium channel type A subunit alpha-1 isoform X2 [Hydra vulgaris]
MSTTKKNNALVAEGKNNTNRNFKFEENRCFKFPKAREKLKKIRKEIYRKTEEKRTKNDHSSLFILGSKNIVRLLAAKITKSKIFEYFILLSIMFTCVIMALDVPLANHDKSEMNIIAEKIEIYLLAIFGTEALLKIIANGFILHPHSYLRSLWNVIDFVVIVISIVTLPGNGLAQVNVKSLRAIRVLRPLKLITGIPSLHVVMTSIMRALIPLLQVLFLLSFVISIYAIIGLEFMVERFHYSCKNKTTGEFVDIKKACDHLINGSFFVHGHKCREGEICSRYVPGVNYGITSFDNIFLSVLTVFQCVTTEGWSDIMYHTHDVMDQNGYIWSTYYTTLILLGSFFMLNLVLGVLSGEFAKERLKVENRRAFINLRQDKQLERSSDFYLKWISKGEELLITDEKAYSKKISESINNVVSNKNTAVNSAILFSSNENMLKNNQMYNLHTFQLTIKHLRLKVRNIIKNEIFFWFVIAVVFVNTGVMATYHYKEPKWLDDTHKIAEKVFISIFIVELLMKVFALTFHGYCQSSLNVFELIVIILSIFEAFTPLVAGLRVLRCLRLLRVFKVTRYWSTLRNLVASLMNAMNSILSLLFLLLLYMLITALLGMQLFSGKFSKQNEYPRTNFDSFPDSLLAVFQVVTGEDWNTVMYSGMIAYGAPDSAAGILVSLYFLFLVIFGNYTLLNVFLAIAVDNLTNAEILTQDEEREEVKRKNNNVITNNNLDLPETHSTNFLCKNSNENSTAAVLDKLMQDKDIQFCNEEANSAEDAEKLSLSSEDNVVSNLPVIGFSKIRMGARDSDVESLDKYKSSVQKKWLKIVDYSPTPNIFLNVNAEILNKSKLDDSSVKKNPVDQKKLSDQIIRNIEQKNSLRKRYIGNSIKNNNTLKSSLKQYMPLRKKSLEEDFETQMKHQGFLNMLKVNLAQRKRINRSIPVLNVSSLFIFSPTNRFRLFCHKIVNLRYFDHFMIAVIILSSAALAVEDPIDRYNEINSVLVYCDYVFTIIFGLEIFLKIIDTGVILHKGAFLRNSWNKLDTFVFICSLLALIIDSESSFLKILHVLRVLRPIKAIQKVKKLKLVFQCMVYSLKNVAFVLIITFLMLFIFACIGVQLFQGRFYYCSDESRRTISECKGQYYIFESKESINKVQPQINDRIWRRYDSNFDNVFDAILTLYISSTEDNWPTLMQNGMDVTGVDLGPLTKNSSYMAMYFVMFVVIFTFMIINIYIALIILTFQKQGEKQIHGELDRNQRDCLDHVLNAKPRERFMPKNKSSISFRVWLIVDSILFDYFIMLLIVLNCIQLMMKYNGMSQEYRNMLLSLNIGFTMLYFMEAFLKIIAYRLNYFKDLWNLFDLAVILGGLLDIILTLKNSKFLDPSMFRLFRAARVMKLLRKGTNIRIMLWTFLQSFKALPYVTGLILLMSYVYAVIGMQLFGNIALDGNVFHDKNNFRNVYRALLLLFRCSTGDNWSAIMYACYASAKCDDIYTLKTKNIACGHTGLAILYFTSYIFFCMFLLLNLFVAVIMDNFEYLTRDTSILGPHHIDEFIRCWSEFDPQASGTISHDKLYGMMCYLSPPIGFGHKCPKVVAYKRLIRMNMPVNPDGTVSFYTTLLSLVRLSLDICTKGDSFESDKELKTTIKFLWPKIKNLQKFFPNSTDEHQMTVGKIFCIKLLVMKFRKSREKNTEESSDSEPSSSHNVIHRLQSLIPGFKSQKSSHSNQITELPNYTNDPSENLTNSFHRQTKLERKSRILNEEPSKRSLSWNNVAPHSLFYENKEKKKNINLNSFTSMLIRPSKSSYVFLESNEINVLPELNVIDVYPGLKAIDASHESKVRSFDTENFLFNENVSDFKSNKIREPDEKDSLSIQIRFNNSNTLYQNSNCKSIKFSSAPSLSNTFQAGDKNYIQKPYFDKSIPLISPLLLSPNYSEASYKTSAQNSLHINYNGNKEPDPVFKYQLNGKNGMNHEVSERARSISETQTMETKDSNYIRYSYGSLRDKRESSKSFRFSS